ncbi:unnamed protein product, partial [Chrysoparadoxa australica]
VHRPPPSSLALKEGGSLLDHMMTSLRSFFLLACLHSWWRAVAHARVREAVVENLTENVNEMLATSSELGEVLRRGLQGDGRRDLLAGYSSFGEIISNLFDLQERNDEVEQAPTVDPRLLPGGGEAQDPSAGCIRPFGGLLDFFDAGTNAANLGLNIEILDKVHDAIELLRCIADALTIGGYGTVEALMGESAFMYAPPTTQLVARGAVCIMVQAKAAFDVTAELPWSCEPAVLKTRVQYVVRCESPFVPSGASNFTVGNFTNVEGKGVVHWTAMQPAGALETIPPAVEGLTEL